MTNYYVDSSPLNYNYYEEVHLHQHDDVSATPGYSDALFHETGGILTIDQDCLTGAALGSGTPFLYVLRRLYIEDGEVFMDGSKVRHVRVDTVASPPTVGDTMTFDSGTVTGEFIRFHQIDGINYMKLRSATGAISSGWTITGGGYTGNTSGTDHVGTLEIAMRQTSYWFSNYSPQQAKSTIEGEWYYLRDSAGDVWTSSGGDSETVEHYSEDFVPAIYVETGNGTDVWEIYFNICTVAFADYSHGPIGRCFHKPVNDATITFGTTANGNKKPPSGARIRVGNIHVGALNSGETDWYNAHGLTAGPTGPNIHTNFSKAEFGAAYIKVEYTPDYSDGLTQTFTDCTFPCGEDVLQFVNVFFDQKYNLVRCGGVTQTYAGGTYTGYMLQFQNCPGKIDLQFTDCMFVHTVENGTIAYANSGTSIGDWSITATNCVFGTTCTDVSAGNTAVIDFTGYNTLYNFDNVTFYSDGPNFLYAKSGSVFKNLTTYSHSGGPTNSRNNHNGFTWSATGDIAVDNINFGAGFKVQRAPLTLMTVDAATYLNFGGGDWDNPADWNRLDLNYSGYHTVNMTGAQNAVLAGWSIKLNHNADGGDAGTFINLQNCTNVRIQNCRFQADEALVSGGGDGWIAISAKNSNGMRFKSVRALCGDVGLYEVQGNSGNYGRMDCSGKFNVEVSDFFNDDTHGCMVFSSGEGPHIDYSGAPSVIKRWNGNFDIPTEGEYVIWESHKLLGHTGFDNVTPIARSTDNSDLSYNKYTFDYQIDTGSGYGSWTSLTIDKSTLPANLVAETVSAVTGFKIKLRATRTAVAGDALLYTVWLFTTTTATAQRDNLHPIDLVPVQVTCKDVNTKAVIEDVAVVVLADTGGPLPSDETVTITRSGSTATVSHTAHGLKTGLKVDISGAVQQEYNGEFTITVVNDNSYTFVVSGTPTSPATGTIKCTAIVAAGFTNASGIFLDSEVEYFGSDQPVTGWARKGTTAPFYHQSDITGTMTNNGLTLTQLMVSD